MKIKIGDQSFKLKLLSREKYDEVMDEDSESEAMTDLNDNTITFAEDSTNFPSVVRHELFHAYFSLNLVNSSNLDMVQTEELSAEIVGKYGEDIVKLGKKITTWIKKKKS
jgi:glucuronate isomerase